MSLSSAQGTVISDSLGASTSDLVERLCRAVEEMRTKGVSEDALQNVLTPTVALYFQEYDRGNHWQPVRGDSELSATAILTLVTMLMRSADIGLFELGLWQNWSGPHNS